MRVDEGCVLVLLGAEGVVNSSLMAGKEGSAVVFQIAPPVGCGDGEGFSSRHWGLCPIEPNLMAAEAQREVIAAGRKGAGGF